LKVASRIHHATLLRKPVVLILVVLAVAATAAPLATAIYTDWNPPTDYQATNWSNPERAYIDDGSDTRVQTTGGPNGLDAQNQEVVYYDFGNELPAGAAIKGIEVLIGDASQGGGGGNPSGYLEVEVWDGTAWRGPKDTGVLGKSGSPTTVILGDGGADLWGGTWTREQINSEDFKVSITSRAGSSDVPSNWNLDYVAVRISYIPAAEMTVSYAISGGGSPSSAPVLTYVNNVDGQTTTYTLTETSTVIYAQGESSWSVAPNPLSGSTDSERWYSTQTLAGTAPVAGESTSMVFTFNHQFKVSFDVSPSGAGTVNAQTPDATPSWYNANSKIDISAVASAGYEFSSWTVSAGSTITFDAGIESSTKANISSAGTIVANFAESSTPPTPPTPEQGTSSLMFLPPIGTPGHTDPKGFKLGSTIPVKFQLKDNGGDYVSNAVAKIQIAEVIDSVAGTPTDAVSTSAATTGNLFRFDPDGHQYIFNLKTKGLDAGTYRIIITINGDAQPHTVDITLRS
jgi:hypothetical protein